MQHRIVCHPFTMWHQLPECNAGETNATTVTASLLGPDDTSTDVVMDSLPDTVALDWRNISCSIYKVGCCQDCLSSHLWSYSWLHCSCSLSMLMPVVMFTATLLMSACVSAGSCWHLATAVALVKKHSNSRQVLQGVLDVTALSCALSSLGLLQKALSHVITAARLLQESSPTLQAFAMAIWALPDSTACISSKE